VISSLDQFVRPTDKLASLKNRAKQYFERAELASTPEIKAIHLTLAEYYRERVDALMAGSKTLPNSARNRPGK